MATNCRLNPTGMLGWGIVKKTDMYARVAEETVRVVPPEIPPKLAVMVAVPTETAVASPLLLTVATGFDKLQVTCVVKS